ncbi:MAG TPA: sigma factor-like helix-turn-helix DNA-binding protein [Actinocrinis sp.]|nr:sigma factor-like helix-turn-helix DNA-binding protein [Actinocrinis sp.]
MKTLPAWLTTVTSRICLNMLRSRTTRPEDPAGLHLPDPLIEPETTNTPEDEALLADSISLALLILLDTLSPTERVAFVLHDVFHLTFDEIAPVIDRSPANTRQLTSRARRRLHSVPLHAPDTPKRPQPAQRHLVNAFFTAARAGDLDTLVTLLDPNVELHADGGRTLPSATAHIQGAKSTAQRATLFRHPDVEIYPVRVNGTPGALVERGGTPTSVMAFTIHNNHITQIHILLDSDRLAHIDFAAFH